MLLADIAFSITYKRHIQSTYKHTLQVFIIWHIDLRFYLILQNNIWPQTSEGKISTCRKAHWILISSNKFKSLLFNEYNACYSMHISHCSEPNTGHCLRLSRVKLTLNICIISMVTAWSSSSVIQVLQGHLVNKLVLLLKKFTIHVNKSQVVLHIFFSHKMEVFLSLSASVF